MKLILSHPTANNNSRTAAYKLAQEDMLYEFYTAIASFPGDFLSKLQGVSFLSEIQRRNFDIALKPYTRLMPWLEVGRILSQKLGFSYLTRNEYGIFSVDSVYRGLDYKIASGLKKAVEHGVDGVYAYEDGALATFKQAKELGIKRIYDLPIAYWELGKKLMSEEADRLPGWASTLGGGLSNSANKLERKKQELELADLVLVPSQFVNDSLPDWAKNKKVIIAPFGTPVIKSPQVSRAEKGSKDGPLRVLFAGSMSQRKGLGDLFAAVKKLNNPNIELVVMGELQAPMEFYRNELSDFTYEHVRPNHEVLSLMKSCDVFCLPSIVEGRALVMQEAMSQGLPLIITPNTGGEDLIIEGETGFLVPIRSPDKIAEKLTWFLENRSDISRMGNMAKLHAEKYTWEKYGNLIANAIKELNSPVL
jgi:glycosyltransferase involved in cell wall biosynthesis